MPVVPSLAAFQAAAQSGWVGPTVALSLVAMAAAFALMAVVILKSARKAEERSEALARDLHEIREQIEPTLMALREAARAGQGLAGKLEEEVREIIRTSQRIRHDLDRGVRRAKRRLRDFDALAEVVQDEIEDTALDVAATLRTLRRGKGVIGRIRRLIRGKR